MVYIWNDLLRKRNKKEQKKEYFTPRHKAQAGKLQAVHKNKYLHYKKNISRQTVTSQYGQFTWYHVESFNGTAPQLLSLWEWEP